MAKPVLIVGIPLSLQAKHEKLHVQFAEQLYDWHVITYLIDSNDYTFKAIAEWGIEEVTLNKLRGLIFPESYAN